MSLNVFQIQLIPGTKVVVTYLYLEPKWLLLTYIWNQSGCYLLISGTKVVVTYLYLEPKWLLLTYIWNQSGCYLLISGTKVVVI